MRFYTVEDHPLRIYIESNERELYLLMSSLQTKFYRETEYSNEDDLRNIIFIDEVSGKPYFAKGLSSVISAEASRLSISVQSDVDTSICTYEYEDVTEDILEGISLREYQIEGVRAALRYKFGLIQVATGGGKTEMMIAICKYLMDRNDGHILICVPSSKLLHQTYDRLVLRGINPDDISKYGDGNKIDTNRRVAIATVQTVHRRLEDEDFKCWYDQLICLMMDEAHHCSARTFYTVIDTLAPEYMLGVSAEPFYGDKDHMIQDLLLRGIVGPVIHRVTVDYLVERGFLSKPYMIAVDSKYPGDIYKVIDWRVVNKSCIVNNRHRNQDIINAAVSLIERGKNPLILVSQIKHGDSLSKEISNKGYRVAMLTGGSKVTIYMNGQDVDSYKDPEGDTQRQFQNGSIDVLIGSSVMDEGVDLPALSSVILAGGGKSSVKLCQRVGRGLRPKLGDNTTIILDFQDRFNVVTHSHFKTRKQSIEKLGVDVYYINDVDKQLGEFVDYLCKNRP